MAKRIKLSEEVEQKLVKEENEQLWNVLSEEGRTDEDLIEVGNKIDQNKQEEFHDAFAYKFLDEKELANYDGELTAQQIQDGLKNITVKYGSDKLASYLSYYNLPKVTEENKNGILAHFITNLSNGEYSKEFLNGKLSFSRNTSLNVMGAEPEYIEPHVHGLEEAQRKADIVKAPKPKIGFFASIAGRIQRAFNIDGRYKDQLESYEKRLARWNEAKKDKASTDLVNKYNDITKKYEKMTDPFYEAAKKQREEEIKDSKRIKETARKREKIEKTYNDAYKDADERIANLKYVKVNDEYIKKIENDLKTLDKTCVNMSDSHKAYEKYTALQEKFENAMKEQNKLRSTSKSMNSDELSQKLGVDKKSSNKKSSSSKSLKTASNNKEQIRTNVY